ncbi:hypothetical protein NVIE_1985 [Nitrososphaera viennensis EN76]|uniref:Uncharacterized protein n=1 Tax=Nitrososphaera viennensis EN76 TaxID=926571 RepID=A0A060HLV2_9ARCH|nr:hypothetical protein NVIE_1985 [Nitrososphaera viennensis EN76]
MISYSAVDTQLSQYLRITMQFSNLNNASVVASFEQVPQYWGGLYFIGSKGLVSKGFCI